MALKFNYFGYEWTVREGSPPMGSRERTEPSFVDALKNAHPPLANLTDHELASWIVARLSYLTSGGLMLEGDQFEHDTNEVGYKLSIRDDKSKIVAHGAMMIHATRTYFAGVDVKIDHFQSVVVHLLTDAPDDLSECATRVRDPESRRIRTYGWDGYSLRED